MADMRGERTRDLLCEALLASLREKPLERVTVKEVVEAAGVSKKAFYNHYADIIDLAIDCFYSRTGFDRTYGALPPGTSLKDAAVDVLESMVRQMDFARDNPNLTRAILTNMGRSPYYDKAEVVGGVEFLRDFIADRFGVGHAELVDCDSCAYYIFNGATSLSRRWMREGMVEPPEVIAKRSLLLNIQCMSLLTGHALDPAVVEAVERWERPETRA